MGERAFCQTAFNDFVLDNDVIGFFERPVTLASGRTSVWYVNWRRVSQDAFLLDQLSSFVISFLVDRKLDVQSIFGVPEGATKLAVCCAMKWGKRSPDFAPGSHTIAMGRGKAKTHGDFKDRFFLGVPLGSTLVIEDVITTGASMLDCLQQLKHVGVSVSAVLGLTHRMTRREDGKTASEGVRASAGVPCFWLSQATDLLPEAIRRAKPAAKTIKAIEQEFAQFGEKPLLLSKC